MEIKPIAYIHTDLPTKFGLPRQSGLVEGLTGEIVLEPEYRQAEALRGLEDFTHIWLIWDFSHAHTGRWSATVRPPRLGGNTRMGVFATRSPFRPNSLGLSCVRLLRVERDAKRGSTLIVGGADLMNGTPIIDIKPYIPYSDAHPEAVSGFAPDAGRKLTVVIPEALMSRIRADKLEALRGVLANDPRPRYQDDPARVYAMDFAGMNIKFTVCGDTLTVTEIEKSELN